MKPSNILLGEKWEPKLADFVSYKMGLPSLSKALIRVDSNIHSEVQSSTLEHLDPEYFVCGELIDESDVAMSILLGWYCCNYSVAEKH